MKRRSPRPSKRSKAPVVLDPAEEPTGSPVALADVVPAPRRKGCGLVVLGVLLIVVGVPMLVLPGPGLIAIGSGIALVLRGIGLRGR